mgnify:CR=1 FL=1
MLSRLAVILLWAFIVIGGNSQTHSRPPADIFRPDGKSPVACYRIPALAVLPNGSLLAAADERMNTCADLRSNRDINIVIRKSTNGGRTWSTVQTLVDFPEGQSASDPSFIMDTETGELFLFYNYMDLDRAPGIYRFHVLRTSDAGISWSKPQDITSQITRPDDISRFRFITSGNGIRLSDGRLLHTMVKVESGAVQLFGSTNHGRSWQLFGTPVSPADESRVIELTDGRWMVNARVNKAGMRFIHVTGDQGMTWITRPEPMLADPGCNAGMIGTRIKGGLDIILFTNPASSELRGHLSLKASDDGGNSWRRLYELYPGSAAYSVVDVIRQGKLAILFERDDYRAISLIRLRRREWIGSAASVQIGRAHV